jgi:hypothetical protein
LTIDPMYGLHSYETSTNHQSVEDTTKIEGVPGAHASAVSNPDTAYHTLYELLLVQPYKL